MPSAVVLALTTVLIGNSACGNPAPENELRDSLAPQFPSEGFVTSRTCRACHPGQYQSWHDSYHRTMTQVAGPETVMADFGDVALTVAGQHFRLERRDDEFWVEIDRGDGSSVEHRRIVQTTGSHRRQWVWYAAGGNRLLATIPFIYLKHQQRWVPRYAAFLLPPDPRWEPSHHRGLWGSGCISCHTTDGQKRTPETPMGRVSELGIACEACHGPGGDHVVANRDPRYRYRLHLTGAADPTIVNPRRLPHTRGSEVCGQCHAIHPKQGEFRPGEDLTELLSGMEVRDPLPDVSRWPDGKMHTGGREYEALIAAPCYRLGEMSCLSCHTMHRTDDDPRTAAEWADGQVTRRMETDAACLQCHPGSSERAGTGKSSCYDCEEHTHHKPESSGSRCYDCHMPYTSYALLKAIRNHDVDAESVARTLETGRPNACNLCHLDKSLGWTADHLSDWYGMPKPALTEDQSRVAAAALWATTGHAGQRALIAWHMGWEPARRASGSVWLTPYLTLLMNDPYPAVRIIAYRSLQKLEDFEGFPYDSVGTETERQSALREAVRFWRSELTTRTKTGEALLVRPDGTLNEPEFFRLIESRDDRPVVWIE